MGRAATGPHVSVATIVARLCASGVKVRDYDHAKPALLLEQRCMTADGSPIEDALTKYSYAVGRFDDEQGGDRLAGIRLEQARTKSRTYRWEASFAMRPGMKVRLHDHPRDDANGDFLVVSAWSEVDVSTRKHVAEVVPALLPWRPKLRSKPRIHGTQTAFVVGAPGKEIDVDAAGRVEVEFRWDTRNLHRAGASRRVRVAMPWAGRGHGFWTLPRVGDEVVIGYLDGDPDEPMVMGSVHNGISPTVIPLPGGEAQSGWVSQTTPGGDGYNAILMDDAAGKEFLALRAQRDFSCDVSRNSLTKIGGSQALSVVSGQSTEVGGNLTVDVRGEYDAHAKKMTLKADGNLEMTAGERLTAEASVIFLKGTAGIVLGVGSSSITISDGRITLKAEMIELNP